MYPNSIYFGLKVLPIQVHWGHSIYYLGTWTLRVTGSLGCAGLQVSKCTADRRRGRHLRHVPCVRFKKVCLGLGGESTAELWTCALPVLRRNLSSWPLISLRYRSRGPNFVLSPENRSQLLKATGSSQRNKQQNSFKSRPI